MPPALMVFVDELERGVPGLTHDGDISDSLLRATLNVARRVGGVGRVLLFHPPEAEGRLTARALGFRLWPQEGATLGERYANAFRQAADLGYEGALVIGVNVPEIGADRLARAAALLEEHHGAVASDGHGGIALLALQEPLPTLFSGDDLPSYEGLLTRATQQRVRLVELEPVPALTAESLDGFLASR